MSSAIEMLKKDHDEVRSLLKKLTETTDRAKKTRSELLEKIDQELRIHAKLEEEIFYPAFREAGGKEHEKMFHEAVEEHRAVEDLVLPDLQRTDPTSRQFAGRAKVLKELIEHHADEEEEEMFPRARKALSKDQLQELAERMQKRKEQLRSRV